MELSLGAELLMLAVDTRDGGLVPHDRRRLLKALAAAEEGGSSGRLAGRSARRRAMRELEAAGLVGGGGVLGRMKLTDPAAARARLAQLVRGMTEGELSDGRDREVLLLLAWAGVLVGRLSKSERRIAARRLRSWGQAASDVWQPEGQAPAPIPDAHGAVAALGGMVALSSAAYDGFGSFDAGGDGHHHGGHHGGAGTTASS